MPCYAIGDTGPTVAIDAWVAPSAELIGDARLGAEASIWFGAVIRADNSPIVIGPRSNIQECAVLHSDPGIPCTVGAGVTVGHHAILHGCTIGDHALIGMGATILNRAVIGEESLVGAGALVTEGKSFPPRSLIVGAPAKAVRALSAEEVAGLHRSAAGYVGRAKLFAANLRRID